MIIFPSLLSCECPNFDAGKKKLEGHGFIEVSLWPFVPRATLGVAYRPSSFLPLLLLSIIGHFWCCGANDPVIGYLAGSWSGASCKIEESQKSNIRPSPSSTNSGVLENVASTCAILDRKGIVKGNDSIPCNN